MEQYNSAYEQGSDRALYSPRSLAGIHQYIAIATVYGAILPIVQRLASRPLIW
jgi:hypothetical protein